MKEMFEQIGNTLNKIGVTPPTKNSDITVEKIKELGIDSNLDSLEELLNQLVSYNIFLKSQKASFEAQLIIKQGELKRKLYLETQNMPKRTDDGTYLTKEEKESLVLSGQLKVLYNEVLKLQAIVARLKDIPFAIDKKIELFKMKYRRLLTGEN